MPNRTHIQSSYQRYCFQRCVKSELEENESVPFSSISKAMVIESIGHAHIPAASVQIAEVDTCGRT